MKKLRLWTVTLLLVFPLFLPIGIASDVPFADVPFDINDIPAPVPPPKEVRDFFQLDQYYQQWINVRGFPVLASAEVSPYAVKEAAWTIGHMVGHRPDILKVMAQNKARFSIVPHNKHLPDIPEYDFGRLDFFWEMRARGIGGLTTTSPEENIICGDSNYCYAELIHEFAHQLHGWGLNRIDSTFDSRLETLYNAALKEGLYQERYAGSNRWEYWAEGVGSWFNGPNRNSNVAHTRLALKKYDPRLATLLTEVFGDGSWRYTPPATRTHLPHLQGFNPQEAPIYQRPPELLELEEQLRDPNSDGGGKWVNLKLYDPSGLSHLKKLTTGGNRTDFLFGNLTGTDLALYSFNADGKKILYQYSTTTDFLHVMTKVGAIWLIQDHTGKGITVFRAEEEVGRVLITPTTVFITSGLSKVSGANQTGVSGAVLANPFVIEVWDENLSVLEGIEILFTVTTGDGTLSVIRTTTDENGRAESTLTLGPNLETNTVTVSAVGVEGTVTFTAIVGAAVDIPDRNLRTAIETTLGKTSGAPITASEMETLRRFEARNANISDLTGLEHATHLKELGLGGNNISDLSTIAGLTNLTRLSVWGNSISDIAALAGLTNLTALVLGSNNISDISPAAGLTRLISLHLPGNYITDLSSLSSLTNLKTLWLNHNSISDLSPLVANTGLGSGDTVNVKENPLSDHSIHTHIPDLQSRGVTVEFDNRLEMGQNKITGPWLWMIAPTAPGQGGANSNNVDSLAAASNGDVTEAEVAANGAKEGDAVGNYVWTLGQISGTGGNNINDLVNAIGMKQGDVNDHSSYALITLESITAQSNVTMRVGSDDSIKVWLNGEVVHNNPINRGATDFQDNFTVNLKQGDNLLLVKVSERDGGWSMFIGIDADVNAVYKRPPDAVVSADVNDDGVVNVLDLIVIASKFGNEGQNLEADINGDGTVSILDLVLAAGMFEGAAAAPSAQAQAPETLTAVEVQGWLTDARALEARDPIMKRGFLVLEQLLVALTPKETELLSNYPNPFNPETWIPYRLAEDANVTLTIYGSSGQVVRTLDVGHRIASAYESRSKAVYWDGRNDVGEQVASGVYFYTLTAGDFSATRRMVILK